MKKFLLTLSFLCLFFSAHAQDQTIDESPKVLKKIVVTGSYIKRTVDEGAPSPVSVIDNTKAQEAGSFSASGMLKDNAVISGASSNFSGNTNISFHGQNSANNLVLLNGLRLPKGAGEESVNIDFIPASAIERVEILKDGASALYGSEALAGVVNIITKKEYEGANIAARGTLPEIGRGSEANIIATYGKNFKRGNILSVFQYRTNQRLMYPDTEYGIKNVKLGGSLTSNPGNLQLGTDTYYRAADCPPAQVDGSGRCRYNHYNTLSLSNPRDHYNLLLSGGYNLPNNLRIEGSLLLAHQRVEGYNTPKIINLEDFSAGGTIPGAPDYSIPGSTANTFLSSFLNGSPTFNNADKLRLLYSADQELGVERSKQITNNGTAQFKIGQESENFDWDFSVGYGLNTFRSDVYEGNARMDILHQKILNGTWNPFKPAGSKDSLRDAMVDTWNSNFSDVWNARLIASGRLLNLGEKSIYAAFGSEGQLQRYNFRADSLSLQNLPLTGLASNQDGERDVQSYFLEFTQNPTKELQLQAAVRMDKYSDFGTTLNPKLAVGYQINKQLAFRSSFGTGFKAPDLRSLYQGNITRPQRFRDNVICTSSPLGDDDPNCNNLFSTTTRGNPNLDAEKGKHWNFGLQMRPKKNWTIGLDHWRASGTDALNTINLSNLTAAENQLGAGVLNGIGVTIVRDPVTNVIQSVLLPLRTNSGRYDVNGIDLDIKYSGTLQSGVGYTFRTDHSHTISNGNQPFSFQGYEKQLDLNWRNLTSLSLTKGIHLVSLRARTFSARDKDTNRSNLARTRGSIPVYTEYDLHYEMFSSWEGVVTVGIRNILNYKVYNQYNNGAQGFLLPASDTLLGRTFYVGYSQDF